MTKFSLLTLMVSLALARGTPVLASSVLPLTTEEHIKASAAVFRGTVVNVSSYRNPADGQIYTRTVVRVDETFKGKLPPAVKLVHRGGTVDDEGETISSAPQFQVGEERLLFVSRRSDGTLFATQGGTSAIKLQRASANGSITKDGTADFIPRHRFLLAEVLRLTQGDTLGGSDVTDQAADTSAGARVKPQGGDYIHIASVSGLIVDGSGVPARFIQCDRGEPIHYVIDADSLPAGITQTQAVTAVQNALAAWTAVTSLKYSFDGLQSFGVAAANLTNKDGRLYIQLHDNYNFINSSSTLGIGGQSTSGPLLATAGWGRGGNVDGEEFHLTTKGFVVLERTNTAMQTLSTFTEVLCHEIGHSLGMAHSSEDPNEPTGSPLYESIMYYLAHADGRGATLGSYDPPVIQQAHPQANTPPYTYPRVLDITSASTTPSVEGINEVEPRGYDLQTTNLSLATTNDTASNGTFARAGNRLQYTPSGFFSDSGRLDPAGSSYWDQIDFRYSDGTNASPYVSVRILSFNADSHPFPTSDGVPDNWMSTYFGNPDPAAGANRGANQDNDGDRLTNLQEYIAGMDPTSGSSAQRITLLSSNSLQWQAKPYELYELQGSTNLTTWTRVLNPILPTTSTGTATGFFNSALPRQYFRIQKVP
ncbi:MAG: hypothetical protein HY298_16100 [Verrucomicrobia bacterium]|nr:hypothetical protein [Verrucomicrobiota bacterium]